MESSLTLFKTFFYALFTLVGTIIGVGFFALPFVTAKVGILTMLFYFLVLGIIVIIVHLLFAQIVVKTKGTHRLPGYAEIYLGNKGKIIASISSILGLYGALLSYLIVGGSFINSLPLPFLSNSLLFSVFFFFCLGAIFIYFGISSIAKIEVLAFFLFLGALFLILAEGQVFWNLKNLFNFQPSFFFLPYGVLLFSLWGAALVPEVAEMLKRDKKLTKRAITGAISLSAFIYLFFIILITGICGEMTSKDAISGLEYFFSDFILAILLSFGILACFTSFITLGLTLKKVFWYDFKMKRDIAWFLACFLPLFLYLLGVKDFIKVISIAGGIMLALDAILVILIYLKLAEKESWGPRLAFRKYFLYFLILIFLLGILYEFIYGLR